MSKESIKIQIDIDRYKNKISNLKNRIQILEEDSSSKYKSVQDLTVSFELAKEAMRIIEENHLERNRILGQIKTTEKRINYKKEDLILLKKRESKHE